MTRKYPHATARALNQKFETQIRTAGELSSLLRPIREAEPLYAELQAKERELRVEKEALDSKLALIGGLGAQLEDAGNDLATLSEMAVTACELHGPTQVRAHLEIEGADVASSAEQVIDAVRHVPHAGRGLARWLAELRAIYVEIDTRRSELIEEFEGGARMFAANLLKTAATISEARALLINMGIRFPFRPPRARTQVIHMIPLASPPFPPRPSLPAVG